jgi:hypothetical protein
MGRRASLQVSTELNKQLTVHKVLKFREIADALNLLSMVQPVPKAKAKYPVRRAYFRSLEVADPDSSSVTGDVKEKYLR